MLFGAKIVGSVGGLGANLVFARALGYAEYGQYAFAIATLTFLSQFFDFGYFSSGARLLTVARTEAQRRGYYGAILAVGGLLSGTLILLTLAISRVVDAVFTDKIGSILATSAFLTPALVSPFLIEQILKSTKRMTLLALWTASTKIAFLAAAVALWVAHAASAHLAVIAYLTSTLLGLFLVIALIRPSFFSLRHFLRRLAVEQRRFGRQLYLGKVVNLASYNADKLLLAYFVDATAVGYYSLAMLMGSGVTMFSQSVAAIAFSDFAGRRPIRQAVKQFNWGGIVLVGITILVAGWLLVRFYLGTSYAPVLGLLPLATLAGAFQGAYQPYNSWLLANGLGVELRRFLILVAAVNVSMNLLLIPLAGALGATVASTIGMAAYLFMAVRTYRTAQDAQA